MFRARRIVRRGVRRGFRRLSRAAVISMAAVAGGVTLATIATRENVSREEAEAAMEDMVSEGVVRKEKRDGETVYLATSAPEKTGQAQQAVSTSQVATPAQAPASVKFCRNCGAKIARESKFCEECGTRVQA